MKSFAVIITMLAAMAAAAPRNLVAESLDKRQTCGAQECSIDTDCYAWRCGACNGGTCGCPPEGC